MTIDIQGNSHQALSCFLNRNSKSQNGIVQYIKNDVLREFTVRVLYPARLSFRFDREIKSFPDKQNLREFSATKPSFTTNAKGTFLGRKHKRRKRPTKNKPS